MASKHWNVSSSSVERMWIESPINEIEYKNTNYIYLVNPKNELDVMIRKQSKEDKDLYIPLESDDEFNLANLLLFKETNKKD